jgi:hypothetical protein
MEQCRFADCPNTATKDSHYCLTHDEVGQQIIKAMLNLMAPAPVLPRSKVFDGITIAIRQETES